jgi:hypothetical protein
MTTPPVKKVETAAPLEAAAKAQPTGAETNANNSNPPAPAPVAVVPPPNSPEAYWSVLFDVPGHHQDDKATVFVDGVEVGSQHLDSGFLKVWVPRKENFRPTHFVVQIGSLPPKELNEMIDHNDQMLTL